MDIFFPSIFEFVAQPFLHGILLCEVSDLDFSLQLDILGSRIYGAIKLKQISFSANFFLHS